MIQQRQSIVHLLLGMALLVGFAAAPANALDSSDRCNPSKHGAKGDGVAKIPPRFRVRSMRARRKAAAPFD